MPLFAVELVAGIVYARSYEQGATGAREVARVSGPPGVILPALASCGALGGERRIVARDWRESGIRRGASEGGRVLAFDAPKPEIKAGIVGQIADRSDPLDRAAVAAEQASGGNGLRSGRIEGVGLDGHVGRGRAPAARHEPLGRNPAPAGKSSGRTG